MALFERNSSIEGFGLGLSGPSRVLASASASAFASRGTHVILMSANWVDQRSRLLMQGLEVLRLDFPSAVQLFD